VLDQIGVAQTIHFLTGLTYLISKPNLGRGPHPAHPNIIISCCCWWCWMLMLSLQYCRVQTLGQWVKPVEKKTAKTSKKPAPNLI